MRSNLVRLLTATALLAAVPTMMAFSPPKKVEAEAPAVVAFSAPNNTTDQEEAAETEATQTTEATEATDTTEATDAAATEGAPAAGDDWQNDPLLAGADVERGQAVYQRVAVCVNCHGWNGNGLGANPRSEGDAANLRDTGLDTQGLMDVIACGIPGTAMPFHLSAAYRDPEVCFGMTMADFEAGTQPRKGKTFREQDLINLVAYLEDSIVGAGETTLEQCEAYFEPGSAQCNNLRD